MNNSFGKKLETAIQKNLTFALFREPDQDEIGLLVDENFGSNHFLMHSFDSETERSIASDHPVYTSVEDFPYNFSINLNSSRPIEFKTQEEYENLIERTIQKIKNSELEKIVISRIKVIPNSSIQLFQTFRKLAVEHPSTMVYLWHSSSGETWLGATPELLLKQVEDTVETVSLAGTKLPEIEWTEKERTEQQLVTDYLSQHFSTFQQLEITSAETVEAGKFHHLKSLIRAKLPPDFEINELVKKLHPSPAVCGLPKEKAFDFIMQNEKYSREFYTGYIGLENERSKSYYVNLRCAQFFKDQVWMYVGGGITSESQPQKEWEETELKSGTILQSLVY